MNWHYGLEKENALEIKAIASPIVPSQTFIHAAKWSPDGSRLLASYEDKSLRIHAISSSWFDTPSKTVDAWDHGMAYREAEHVNAFDWYPWMQPDGTIPSPAM
jgi:hypothetical protein